MQDQECLSRHAADALEQVPIDYVMPLRGLAPLLTDLVGQRVVLPDDTKGQPIKDTRDTLSPAGLPGPISESPGSISEFTCRVGHRYSPVTFFAAHAQTRERALWAAVHEWPCTRPWKSDASWSRSKTNASAAEKTRELLGSLIQESTGI